MCVAELNVSTLPCQHRWYRLVRSCSRSTNLGNCPGKLGLDGWEIRSAFCPFCDAWNVDTATYRLIGQDRSASHSSLHRTSSQSLSMARRESRTGSLARTDSSRSMTSLNQIIHSEKNRSFNNRLDNYLTRPNQISTMLEGRPSDVTEEDFDRASSSPTETGSQDSNKPVDAMARPPSTMSKSSSKPWKNGRKLSKILNFVR